MHWLVYCVGRPFPSFCQQGSWGFFFQERPGKDEKVFKVIKFKTMTDERDADVDIVPIIRNQAYLKLDMYVN